MKNWFKNLAPDVRKKTLIIFWIATVVLFFIIGIAPENSTITDICVLLWLGSLVCSIIFSVWAAKFKKEADNQSKSNSAVAPHYTPKATIPIYSPKSDSDVPLTSVSKTSNSRLLLLQKMKSLLILKIKPFSLLTLKLPLGQTILFVRLEQWW